MARRFEIELHTMQFLIHHRDSTENSTMPQQLVSNDCILDQLKKTTLGIMFLMPIFCPMRASAQRFSGTHQQQNQPRNDAGRMKRDVCRKRSKSTYRDCASFSYLLLFILAGLAFIRSSAACSELNLPQSSYSFSGCYSTPASATACSTSTTHNLIKLDSTGGWRPQVGSN
jgi:hypothetical protein